MGLNFKYIIFCFLMVGVGNTIFAQSMSSPYSAYAIGDMDPRVYNYNSGMGYTGLALKTTLTTAGNNPASVAGFERSFFSLDVSGAGKSAFYSGTNITADNSTNKDFTIKKLSLTTKVNAFWGSSLGFKQFSSVNYSYLNTKGIEGSSQSYALNYSGDGGLNQYYWSNAFAIGKHLSVGVTASYLAGPVNETETVVDNSNNNIQTTRRDYYSNFKFDYGFIYNANISKKWGMGIGAKYSNQSHLNYDRTLNVLDNTTSLVTNQDLGYSNFYLPTSYGVGIAVGSKTGTTTFAADYTHEDWSSLHTGGDQWQLINTDRLSVGAEFASFQNVLNKAALKKSFQVGAYIGNSYVQVKGYPINEYGVTAGITRSLKNGLLYGVSLEGGSRGTTQNNLIKENFVQLTVSFSFRDFIYSKGHKYN